MIELKNIPSIAWMQYTPFDPAAKAYLTERLSILNALGDNSEDTSTELNKGEQIVDDLDPELITLIPFGTVIDEIRATVLFDFIVDDGVYSNREKKKPQISQK